MSATVRDFLSAYILGIIAFIVINYALTVFADYSLPGSVSVVPFIIAVQVAAQRFATRTGKAPTKGESWRAALAMALSAIALSALLLIVVSFAFGADQIFGPGFSDAFDLTIALTVFGLVFVVYALLARFSFSWLARAAVRNAERLKGPE